MKRAVIVADNSFVVETFTLALRSSTGFHVIGKVDGRAPVGPQMGEAQPDVVLIDEMQDDEHALDRIRECVVRVPAATVLLLTTRMDEARVAKAVAAGAAACLSKTTHLPSLGVLIREIVGGNVVSALPPALSDGTLVMPGTEELTAREREILGLVAHGLTNVQIGKRLWVTQQTVKFHLSNIYRKLGVSNRTEASRYAHLHGLAGRRSLATVHALRTRRAASAA